nr:type VI secretion system amidase effector protein Tae4 [uncultured Flavobacterium sp.]
MKKKIIYLSLVITSLLLTNCSVEEKITENHEHSHVKIYEKTFEELTKNEKFNNAFSKLPKSKNTNNISTLGKTVMEDQYGFTISEQPATVLEEENKTSYTFLITRDNLVHNYFENLVVETDNDNTIKAVIIKYNLLNEIQYGLPHSSFNFQYQPEVTPIVYNSNDVNSKLTYIDCYDVVTHLCDWGGTTHIAGSNCSTTYYGTINVCVEREGSYPGGGGYGGGTGSSTLISTTPVTNYYYYIIDAHDPESNYLGLSSTQIAWLNTQTIELRKSIISYFTPLYEGELIASWAINFFMQHPNTTWAQFKSWFLGVSEGSDGEYDAQYWENPNLTFPPQNLPSWNAFNSSFPTINGGYMPAPEVYQLVGGQLYNSHLNNPNAYSNACAIRVSRALNYSGVTIPFISGQTETGADNKNYFLNAKNLNAWMRKTFGVPTGSNHLTGLQGGTNGENFPTLLSSKKGIYIMIANYPGLFATGHADIINNSHCPGECWFNPTGGVNYIDIWELN